ncbi:MAG: SDR family oxidoreductase, partial [Dehalococcoidia bacterium]|nr:SDR family oxidoreductase [Dehalococcoidia bacterium]
AKRGLIAFTKTVALENATLGVTANVVVPHLVESPGWTTRPSAMRDAVLAPVPMKRFGTPDEIAHAVAFFASPEAGYITGEVLHVTGGLEWLGTTIDMARPPR